MRPLDQNSRVVSLETAKEILIDLGMDAERSNDRSCLVLLALTKLSLGDNWSDATRSSYTTRELMDWIRKPLGVEYKPNSRETIRRFTLHQFIQGGLVEENTDCPNRPINSPKWNYCLSVLALNVIKNKGCVQYNDSLQIFKSEVKSFLSLKEEKRNLNKIQVKLPEGTFQNISPGGQNLLIKSMVENFCSRFLQKPKILYLGDASKKAEVINESLLKELKICLPVRGKEPDLIAWDCDRKLLFLMEACSSHGPIDVTRKQELYDIFGDRQNIVFVSCFPDRKTMQRYLKSLAWETECWCSDEPDHMIHLNGEKFLAPYKHPQ